MDTFSSYNQIFVYEPDQENTAFITNCGLYCYKVMSFGLKNIRAIYQQLVNKIFKERIRRTMKVYVDDMIIMSVHASDHAGHLTDTFNVIKQHQMRLNPEKCAFGVTSSKFLNFMVKHRGIDSKLNKIFAIIKMKSLQTIKEVKSLVGQLAALSCFIFKGTDHCKPLF